MSKLFAVLADQHRRDLVARLRNSPRQSLSQLAEGLSITRQAVTKHLDQLARAGLVKVERRGRERLHSLDPLPLREIEEWLEPYAAAWDRRLERLQRHLADGGAARGRDTKQGKESLRTTKKSEKEAS